MKPQEYKLIMIQHIQFITMDIIHHIIHIEQIIATHIIDTIQQLNQKKHIVLMVNVL